MMFLCGDQVAHHSMDNLTVKRILIDQSTKSEAQAVDTDVTDANIITRPYKRLVK